MIHRSIQIIAMLSILSPALCLGATFDPCDRYPAALVVDTSNHTLWMCVDNHAKGAFHIALGRGGVDKQTEGDNKTPLGDFELGSPRYSEQFRLFIPISYPNDNQKSKGLSGGSIGIHGPHRKFLWLGKDSVGADWTYGCIAVGTDEEIMALARWVNEQKITRLIVQ
jgi:hypothetical protein